MLNYDMYYVTVLHSFRTLCLLNDIDAIFAWGKYQETCKYKVRSQLCRGLLKRLRKDILKAVLLD